MGEVIILQTVTLVLISIVCRNKHNRLCFTQNYAVTKQMRS